MRRDRLEIEARLRLTLRAEVADLVVPITLWSRLEAQASRPSETVLAPAHSLRALEELARAQATRSLALALLADQEMDGFTLARRVEDVARQAGCATPAEAALLPLLHQLEREGQVRARWRQGEKGLRRVYSLPGRGHGSRVLARVVGWLGHLSRSVGPATRRGALPAAKRGS